MKTIKLFIILAIVAITGNVYAQGDLIEGGPIIIDTTKPLSPTIPTLDDFKLQFPQIYKTLDTRYVQNGKGQLVTSLEQLSKLNYFTLPAIIGTTIVGRIISHKGNISYLDYSKYTKEISVNYLSKNKSKSSYTVPTVYNDKNKTYEVNANQVRGRFCETLCAISAVAISLGDGPAPLMDIVAVAYLGVCLADCADQ